MDKYQLADYLVNLHTLLNAQEASAGSKSQVVLNEYNRSWEDFKATLKEEHENETRTK